MAKKNRKISAAVRSQISASRSEEYQATSGLVPSRGIAMVQARKAARQARNTTIAARAAELGINLDKKDGGLRANRLKPIREFQVKVGDLVRASRDAYVVPAIQSDNSFPYKMVEKGMVGIVSDEPVAGRNHRGITFSCNVIFPILGTVIMPLDTLRPEGEDDEE